MSEPVAKRRPMIDLDEFERRLRQPSAASRATEDDPLAELARLVGGQDDPYKSVFGPQGQERAAGARDKALPGAPDANERLISGDFSAIEAALLGARQKAPIDETLDAEPAALSHIPDDYSDHWSYEEAAEPVSAPEPDQEDARSRRPLYLMAAIIILGIGGIAASFALKTGPTGQREIATIKASDGPAKIQPEVTEDAPVQDATILNKSAQPSATALADNIEQPVDLSQPREKVTRVIPLDRAPPGGEDKPASGAASVPVPVPPAPVVPAQAQEQSAPLTIAALIEPKKVRTVSVRPDGTLVPNEELPPRQTADVPVPAPRPALPAAKAATPKAPERVATTPRPAPEAPGPVAYAAQPKPAPDGARPLPAQPGAPAAPVVPSRTAGTGAYAVQLAAPASEAEARAIQVKLLKKHAEDLAGFRTSIRKASVGDKTVYRVRVGGLTQEEANALCQKVQSGGSSCFVARN